MLDLRLFALLWCLMGSGEPRAFESAVQELQEAGFSLEAGKVARKREAIAAIRAHGRGSASVAMPELLRHVHSDRSGVVWADALATACALATADDIPKVVAVVRGEIEALAAAEARGDHVARARLFHRTTEMYRIFLIHCVPLLPHGGRGSPELLDLLTEMEVPAERGWSLAGNGLRVVLGLLEDPEAQSQHLIQYIQRVGSDGKHDDTWGNAGALLRGYQTSAVKAGLRRVVRESTEEGRVFNRLAAGILAEWGDAELLPILKELQAVQGDDFAVQQIAQIEAQDPPEKLLQLVSSGGDIYRPYLSGEWALERAIETGLPRIKILEALTSYCERNIEHAWWRFRAMGMKSTAVRLGLIEPGDIPQIPYYTRLANDDEQRRKQAAITDWAINGPNEPVPPSCDFIPFEFPQAVASHPHSRPDEPAPVDRSPLDGACKVRRAGVQ